MISFNQYKYPYKYINVYIILYVRKPFCNLQRYLKKMMHGGLHVRHYDKT